METMKPRFLSWLLLALLSVSLVRAEAAPTSRPDPQRYAKEIAAFAAQAPEKGGIVFTGSSSIRLWKTLVADFPGLPVLNRGFGGSVANDLMVHFETVIARHEPKLLVLYTGGNDINAKLTVDEAMADYVGVLEKVHQRFPATRVIINSVKVSPRRITETPQILEMNRRLQAWAKDRAWVRYVDTTSYLMDASSQPQPKYYVKDMLHLNADGYAEWRKILLPIVQEEWRAAR